MGRLHNFLPFFVMQLFILTTLTTAYGASRNGSHENNYISGYLQNLAYYGGEDHSYENAPAHSRCAKEYESKIIEDGKLTVTLGFGYQDDKSKNLSDGIYFQETVHALTRPCRQLRGGSKTCGFKEDKAKKWSLDGRTYRRVFYKNITIKGRKVKQEITLVHSSKTSNGNVNEANVRDQIAISEMAESTFYGGILGNTQAEPCDFCIYNGHAREGKGIDFGPTRASHPMYAGNRGNYRKMIGSFSFSKKKPAMVAIFACDGQKHFWRNTTCMDHLALAGQRHCPREMQQSLANYSDDTHFIMSNGDSWPHNRGKTIGTILDHATNMKCPEALQRNLDQVNDPRQFQVDSYPKSESYALAFSRNYINSKANTPANYQKHKRVNSKLSRR